MLYQGHISQTKDFAQTAYVFAYETKYSQYFMCFK